MTGRGLGLIEKLLAFSAVSPMVKFCKVLSVVIVTV